MLAVAGVGLAVNIVAFAILHGADRSNLNVRGALLHVLGDMLGSAAAVAAAVVILTTGWTPIDPLLSILVGLLVLRSAWFLVRDAAHVLLEGTPERLDVREIGPDLVSHLAVVEDVHHVHAWSLSQERSLLTLHARIADGASPDAAVAAIQDRLAERFDIRHVTVQIEIEGCTDEPVPAPGMNAPASPSVQCGRRRPNRVTMKSARAATTIEGAGRRVEGPPRRAARRPPRARLRPRRPPPCLPGLRRSGGTVAAGMISRATISRTPTILIAPAITAASRMPNISRARSGRSPAIEAMSALTVVARSGRQIQRRTARASTPPIQITARSTLRHPRADRRTAAHAG